MIDGTISRLKTTTARDEAVKDADLVVEAIVEVSMAYSMFISKI